MSELKPCPNPWCESTDVGIESDSYDSPPVHYAVCNACGNTGPARDTEEAAADVWNTRPKSEAEELLEWLNNNDELLLTHVRDGWILFNTDSEYPHDSVGFGTTPLDALRAARGCSNAVD